MWWIPSAPRERCDNTVTNLRHASCCAGCWLMDMREESSCDFMPDYARQAHASSQAGQPLQQSALARSCMVKTPGLQRKKDSVVITFQLPAMSGVRAIIWTSSWWRATAARDGTPACGEKASSEAVAIV